MTSRHTLVAVLSAGTTVALLVAVGGPGVAVFLFFAAGLLLAALYGEAGASPAPEGGGPSAEGGENDFGGETVEFAADSPAASRGRSVDWGSVDWGSVDWGSVALAYAAGLCLWSVAALLTVALLG